MVRYVVNREVLLPLERVVRVELLRHLGIIDHVRFPVEQSPVGVAALDFQIQRRLPLQWLSLVVLHHLRRDLALL